MTSTATFGGGCFWCLDALYRQVRGVQTVDSGYAGGSSEKPSYDDLHDRDTGHAEVVQITFDPDVITYEELLEIFYSVHDPTTLNKQGNDVGTEYRSIILYHDESQKQIAEEVTNGFAASHWNNPIVTEIAPLGSFWKAEDFHQDFYNQNQQNGYCQVIINPKLQKFRKEFASKLVQE